MTMEDGDGDDDDAGDVVGGADKDADNCKIPAVTNEDARVNVNVQSTEFTILGHRHVALISAVQRHQQSILMHVSAQDACECECKSE